MKKIALGMVTFLLSSIFVMGEAEPIYEYRNDALKKIDDQMTKERDRQRLKKLNIQFEEALNEYIESTNRNSNVIFQ